MSFWPKCRRTDHTQDAPNGSPHPAPHHTTLLQPPHLPTCQPPLNSLHSLSYWSRLKPRPVSTLATCLSAVGPPAASYASLAFSSISPAAALPKREGKQSGRHVSLGITKAVQIAASMPTSTPRVLGSYLQS